MNPDNVKRLLFKTRTVGCYVCGRPRGHENFVVFNESFGTPVYFCDHCSSNTLHDLAEKGLVFQSVEKEEVDGMPGLIMRFSDVRPCDNIDLFARLLNTVEEMIGVPPLVIPDAPVP